MCGGWQWFWCSYNILGLYTGTIHSLHVSQGVLNNSILFSLQSLIHFSSQVLEDVIWGGARMATRMVKRKEQGCTEDGVRVVLRPLTHSEVGVLDSQS